VQIRPADRGEGDTYDRLTDSGLRVGDLFDPELLYASEHIRSHRFSFSHFNLLDCCLLKRVVMSKADAESIGRLMAKIRGVSSRKDGDFAQTLGGYPQ